MQEKSVLIMENLFYNLDISNKFDLKGSDRNRLVDPKSQNGEIVLLDENLIKSKMTFFFLNKLYIFVTVLFLISLQCLGLNRYMFFHIARQFYVMLFTEMQHF